MTNPPTRVDGRTARSERTRAAIIDAHLQLIGEGDMRPTADRVAKLAGVSLRALWSHFADMEALMTASGERVLARRDASYRPIPADLPLAERIEAFCHQRARLMEELAPAARAGALKEPFSPGLQHYRGMHISRVRDELTSTFPSEIGSDDDLLNALTAASFWPTWALWRDAMGLSVESARIALSRLITAMLAPAVGARSGV
ncbi:TetR/AcrR family transcriptional regulator [Actinoplanes sp. NEAU-A12]|uniref:TetR/AcrR family transcriptional regulator n=1 Tax=Actinoplanes sandaracinus TaxID=3045177 RepID=A0ABT6WIZ2_9ACTN|nr:TetR/AcrR family transcriptional regulator [Actinoplanes sandaracinus]MDI6099682.1 TetR/AcrR family transcriptional regulator [Actinoplanes sandaracinus]